MPLVGRHVYRCFKSCSFIPYFDTDPLDRADEELCFCEHLTPSSLGLPSSSTKRPSRGKSGASRPKAARLPSIASLLDIGFSQWASPGGEDASRKQNGRSATKGASRRKSDKNAPNVPLDGTSENNGKAAENKDVEPFRFYEDTSRYMAEYRTRHVQRLVGYDGCSDPEYLVLGDNIPDPYIFRTAPFKRACEALQSALLVGRRQSPSSDPKRASSQTAQAALSVANGDREWRPSGEVKLLPGLPPQSIFTSNIDAVCNGMRHVGKDVFKTPSQATQQPVRRQSEHSSTASSRRSVTRQNSKAGGESDTPDGMLELTIAQSRLAMRDRLGVNDQSALQTQSRGSSSSSTRGRQGLLPPAGKSTTMYDETEDASKTMMLLLQKARLDVDKAREKRARQFPSPPAPSNRNQFTAMLCREKGGNTSCEAGTLRSKDNGTATGQLRNGRLKMKVFRATGTGDIKLEDALKAGRVHVTVGQGT